MAVQLECRAFEFKTVTETARDLLEAAVIAPAVDDIPVVLKVQVVPVVKSKLVHGIGTFLAVVAFGVAAGFTAGDRECRECPGCLVVNVVRECTYIVST